MVARGRPVNVRTLLFIAAVASACCWGPVNAAEQTPEAIARLIYSNRAGDVRKHLSAPLARADNAISPNWLYGGYYPDMPKETFKVISKTSDGATIEVKIEVAGAKLQRTLYFARQGKSWVINRVTLDAPKRRDLP